MDKKKLQKLIYALPKIPGIHGKDDYFNSSVLLLLVELNGEYNFIFEKRAADIRQGGEICFPGGKYEPEIDLSYEDTALRETEEELGIDRDNIDIIGRLDTLVAAMGATVDVFVGVISNKSLNNLKINKEEVEKILIVPVSCFKENSPEEYRVRIEIQSSYTDEKGKEIILLPAKKLGLPKRYNRCWGGKKKKVYLYRINEEIIWGITAQLVYDFVQRI